jgi:rhodanese-related sulfurtransferase
VELVERLATPAEFLVLDVRSSKEFQAGHVPGARHIPHTELPQRLTELVGYQQKTVVVYCESGVRAKKAFRVLQTAGFVNVRHLQGDMAAWRDQGLPLTIPAGRP